MMSCRDFFLNTPVYFYVDCTVLENTCRNDDDISGKMLMEHETMKLKQQEEAYSRELKEWKSQLKPRKQVSSHILDMRI